MSGATACIALDLAIIAMVALDLWARRRELRSLFRRWVRRPE